MSILSGGIKDVIKVREDFPILNQSVNGKPLVYLDNAASTQKPTQVIRAIEKYYKEYNSNVHRGVHLLSALATKAYENSRETVRRFINAQDKKEIIFTKGCTEAINLVAHSWGLQNLKPGDEILLSTMEHHANIVPWQMVCQQTGAVIREIPVTDQGEIDLDAYQSLLSDKVKLVGVVHISNTLGTINPVGEIIELAHKVGAKVLIDGAQAMAHLPVDVQSLDVDFYTISGHKVFAPTGIGTLYTKNELLEAMPPYQTGGSMIQTVSLEKSTFAEIPTRFEAGTPNISGAIGLKTALEYVEKIGWKLIQTQEEELTDYALQRLKEVEGIRLIGEAKNRTSVFSFTMACAHAHDIGTIVDTEGVAVRSGHHCTMPLMKRMGVTATTRASFSFYNTLDDVDRLIESLQKVREVFK